jgi:hypothetical protein
MADSNDDVPTRVRDFKRHLEGLGSEGRVDFVDAARRNEDWPEPQEQYLAGHARKWGRGKRPSDYAQLAYDIKNRPGTQVFAYIHPVKRNRGVAFVDLGADLIVLFDADLARNFDLFSPSSGARRWLKDKTTAGTHWRLRDTER